MQYLSELGLESAAERLHLRGETALSAAPLRRLPQVYFKSCAQVIHNLQSYMDSLFSKQQHRAFFFSV